MPLVVKRIHNCIIYALSMKCHLASEMLINTVFLLVNSEKYLNIRISYEEFGCSCKSCVPLEANIVLRGLRGQNCIPLELTHN